MSKKLFSFMIGELRTIRLICKVKNCGAVSEFGIDRLVKAPMLRCPCCKAEYANASADDPLVMLGKALQELSRDTENLDVEFVLPVKE